MTQRTSQPEEWAIQLKEDDLNLPPTQLGKKNFSTITKTMQKGEGNGR